MPLYLGHEQPTSPASTQPSGKTQMPDGMKEYYAVVKLSKAIERQCITFPAKDPSDAANVLARRLGLPNSGFIEAFLIYEKLGIVDGKAAMRLVGEKPLPAPSRHPENMPAKVQDLTLVPKVAQEVPSPVPAKTIEEPLYRVYVEVDA